MTMYNAVHDGDQYRITKFDRDGNVQSSYLCDHVQCQCPAGVRDSCRHRQMLPTFLTEGLVNTNLFLDWDNGRRVVDFQGQPATVQSNEIIEPDLAPQALTDTYAPTQEQQYNRAVIGAGGSITTNYMQDGSVETYATLPHEPTPQPHSPTVTTTDFDSVDDGSIPSGASTPATPWRRF